MMSSCKLFDAHCHIIDPRFPLQANQGFLPQPFTCADYRQRMAGLNPGGGAVVSGSFQGFDQTYLQAALAELGPGFVGVTQLPPTVSDAELLGAHRVGIRALRFNLKRGGSAPVAEMASLAARVWDVVGWPVELYVDAAELTDLLPVLRGLPAFSVDHLGLSRAGLPNLLRLAEQGARVKATGFGRGDLDLPATLRDVHAANPDSLMFGTDLPGTRAPRPFRDADWALINDTLGEEAARKVGWDNARAWYRLDS